MEEKDESQLVDPEHSWLYEAYTGLYYCSECRVAVTEYLLELERDDYPNMEHVLLLDRIVDVECE